MNPIRTLDTRDWDVILIAVLDGVGHGPQAASLTARLIDCLSANFRRDPEELVRECHRSIRNTRGAAMGLASIDIRESQVGFIGVGNVRMQVGPPGASVDPVGPKVYEFVSNKGILGYNLPNRLASFSHEFLDGYVLAMFTDGLGGDFSLTSLDGVQERSAGELVKTGIQNFGKKDDDATLVMVR